MLRSVSRAGRNPITAPPWRPFCTSTSLLEKTLASLVLQQRPQAAPKKRILILSPEETKDKALSRYVDNVGKNRRKLQVPQHIQKLVEDGIYDAPTEEIEVSMDQTIDLFKPSEQTITSYRAHYLVEALVTSFKKDQLLAYVRSHGVAMPRKNKHQIAEMIVGTIWNHKRQLRDKKGKKELRRATAHILKEEYVAVSKFEIFMLLSQQGRMWKDVKSSLSSVSFSADKTRLRMVGTESQLQNARVLMSSRIDACYREEVDLSSIKKLYEEKFGSFSVKSVGKFTEVYFTHLEGDRYELASLNPNQVKRIRRLFLWHLAYNLHQKKSMRVFSTENTGFLPYCNDYSLSWEDRGKSFYQLKAETRQHASLVLKAELERFSEENIEKSEWSALNSGTDFATVDNSEMAKETIELLESIGLLEEDLSQDELAKAEPRPEAENLAEQAPTAITLTLAERDAIYAALTDFSHTEKLSGLPGQNLEEPVFTATLGQVLFEGNHSDDVLGLGNASAPDNLADLLASTPHIFNTNIPLAYDHALVSTATENDHTLLDEDPHVYSLQLKFVPSPFVEEFGDKSLQRSLQDQIKYPPVEMWVQLNSQSVPDLETLQVVTVEAENASVSCFPHARADLRVSCQITGRVLDDGEKPEEKRGESDEEKSPHLDLGALLSATTSNYARFASQPGIVDFLEKSQLDFSGRKPTSIAPWIVLDIGGNKVRYDYVNTSFRRGLTLESGEGTSVQLGVVDGGLLGGRRPEVRFIGGFGGARSNFDHLLDYTLAFISKL